MARARIAADADPDRATVIVHAPAKDIVDLLGLLDGRPDEGAVPQGFDPTEYADGSVVHRETLRRLLCDCRIQLASHAGHTVTGITSPLRTAPPHVQRALDTATGAAASRGARPRGSSTPTTSSGSSTAARPPGRTSPACARSTTGSSTRAAGR